jgi:GT2 family glycosyltransferase/glycosyltransferase involved in cell wall biosynthesis/SAM-dependent methyltransferase
MRRQPGGGQRDPMGNPKVLLVQLEFGTWVQARAWSYLGNFAVEDGLRANGCECVTLPAFSDVPDSSPLSWLHHAKGLLADQRFDQVWVWLVHNRYSDAFWEWVENVAPVRVGLIMESLRYREEDCRRWPHLRERAGLVEQQVRHMTHVLAADERDAEVLNRSGLVQALFWPSAVPSRFISETIERPSRCEAAFYGELYGERKAWLAIPGLADVLVHPPSAEAATDYPRLFDTLHQQMHERMRSGWQPDLAALTGYVDLWRRLREAIFANWLTSLKTWSAIVNLPSLFQSYAGRVVEAMAAGRPVISWKIPDRPRTQGLFKEGQEILLYPKDRPAVLKEHVERIARDADYARNIATAARAELLKSHTAEVRALQWLDWIETKQPLETRHDTGETVVLDTGASQPLAQPNSNLSGQEVHPVTTVFVLTVDDPVLPACKAALDAQQGTMFRLEIIRNVCPFSAAAQRMIRDCRTDYFIQVDEDMILQPDAVAAMEAVMAAAPDDVGMICFHLFDDDRDLPIQGVKIYRTALMKSLIFQDVKASEMDLLEQMGRRGIQWILHPDVKGRHGTSYTVDSIYRRYKTMYEKDIRQWNVLTSDIRRKADAYRQTGDPLQLFALLGAVHGIINAPLAADREKDARVYSLHEFDVFRRLFLTDPPLAQSYGAACQALPVPGPIPFEQVKWKGECDRRIADHATRRENGTQAKSALIVTPHFWPSVGGVERVAEELGVGLLGHGYRVDIATYPNPNRHLTNYKGLEIFTLSPHDRQEGTVHVCALEVERLISSGEYDACVMLGAPVNGLFYGAMTGLLPNKTRLIFQPTLNKEICELLPGMKHAKDLVVRLVARAHHLVVLSEQGCDASFFGQHGLKTTYLPNGIPAQQSHTEFRKEYGISSGEFIILHIANLYPVKNHLGLLDVFASVPQGAKLVVVGHPTDDAKYVEQVRQALAGRPEVLYIPGLSPDGVAAAMQAANVLVVPSHAEASPLCILEAMSHRLPWMATPACDAAHEHAGGVVLPLVDFRRAVALLMQEPALCRAFGETGYGHWEACRQWPSVLEGWIELIETGHLTRSYAMPSDLTTRTTAQRQAFARQLARVDPELGRTTTAGDGSFTSDVAKKTNGGVMNSDAFYVNLFVNAPAWSTPHPNHDESSRWTKIAAFLEYILRHVRQKEPNRQLRILDVGCGRGWLTNLAAGYGTCEGIEPVAGVIDWARKLFPHLRFEVGTAETVLRRSDFVPYDIVLTSEVIEHVPHGQKETFLAQLAQLLTPDGYLILTTPRGEMWEQWKTIAPPNQPVEDWVTEDQLRALFQSQGFMELGLERIHVELPNLRYIPAPTPADLRSMNLLPIYQVWACQRTTEAVPLSFTRTPKVSVIVPTYNRPDRLRTALASLVAQTYQDFEVIVVNDAGCEVRSVIDACADRHRITTICHDRNRGLAAARNSGLRVAKGVYIAYLDDDDRYLPNHLGTLVSYLDRQECRIAYTDAWRVHERQISGDYVETARDVPYSNEFSPADLLISNYFPVLCVMHARQCLDEVGFFDESLFAHEDWDLWIRMATRFPFKHLPVTTAEFTWRSDGTSMTSGTRDTYRRTTEIIYRKYAPYTERNADIREAQQRHLQKFHAEASAKSYVCSIIMPVWNRLELTRNCVTALSEIKDQPEYEVIVVDNGSIDGTAEFLAQLGGDVRIVTNANNEGFAKGCNQGAAVAKGAYLVFLNNDTVPHQGWLGALVAEVESHPEVGVVGSKLLYPDGTVQHAGVVRDQDHRLPYHIYQSFAGDHPAVNKRHEFQIVTAACLLIRRSLFEEVGGFDEGYVNGFEDADLCLKVRERGYAVVYQPRSVVLHLESQTPGRKVHDDTNAIRFLDRWEGQWWAADEDLHFYVNGYKLNRIFRNGQLGGDIVLLEDIKDGASWAHVAAAQAAALKKDWESVKRELRLVDNWPNDQFVLSWGTMVAERLQEPISRAKFLSRYLTLVDAPAERLALIRTLLEQKDLAGAQEHLRILLASSPSHAEGLLMKGVLCMQREQYEQAESAFGSAMREGADRKKCLMGMGMAATGRAYTQGAWERFIQVLEEHPDDAEAIHWLLRAGTEQNRWDELGRHLRKYLLRNPADLAIRFALAGVLVRGEEIEAAHQEYGTLRALSPTFDGLNELGQAIARKQAGSMMEAAHS